MYPKEIEKLMLVLNDLQMALPKSRELSVEEALHWLQAGALRVDHLSMTEAPKK